MCKLSLTPLPAKLSAQFIDYRNGADDPEAGEDISVGEHLAGVGVGPFPPSAEGADDILLGEGKLGP